MIWGLAGADFGLGANDTDGVIHIILGSPTGIVADAVLFSQGPPVSSDGIEAGDMFGDALP